MLKKFFRPGTMVEVWGIKCDWMDADESRAAELELDGWKTSPLAFAEQEKTEPLDEVLQLLRDTAKERGIKGWQRMGEAKLRESLGLNDGDHKG
jgi:hypothetical protein